tara:strand:- start:47 stop:700 length:654 start_codon:yes stop_codon:yes gene_type:complete
VFPSNLSKGTFIVTKGGWQIGKADSEEIINIQKKDGSIIFDRSSYLAKVERNCKTNSKFSLMMMPINNDFYGVSDVFITEFDSACYNIKSNMEGLKYLDSKNLRSSDLSDYHLKTIGETQNVDYVSHGFAYTIEVPNKSSEQSAALGIAASSFGGSNDFSSLIESLPSAIAHFSDVNNQRKLASEAGTYLVVTYYFYDVKSGIKKYIYNNAIIKKLG